MSGHAASDVIYQIDRDAEDIIVAALEERAGAFGGVALVAEGIGEGAEEISVYPRGMREDGAALRFIMDPIDGTRGLMYDKRAAFFLAAAAPNRGRATRLADLEAAVMVEIPTTRLYRADTLTAARGQGARGATRDLLRHTRHPFVPRPSAEASIQGGFAQVSRFFHPGKELLARLEEELLETLFPKAQDGEIMTFEDQYISSGGQLYELLMGHDRFTADLRAGLYRRLRGEGQRTGHTCHPYDVAGHLIGTAAGLVITDSQGQPLDAPLDTTSAVDWIGYANAGIRAQVEPVLLRLIRQYGLGPSP